MSVNSEITRIKKAIADSYDSISIKGGTLPSVQDSEHIAESINTISVGTSVFAFIIATYPAGTTCTCYNGETVIEAKDTSGKSLFKIPSSGTWTVASTAGTSASIEITSKGQRESVDISVLTYGVHWDGTSTQVLTRTGCAETFADPVPYVNGATSYSSPFDNISPWKDMQIVEDSECGTVVSIPKFYYKLSIDSDNSLDLKISMDNQDGFSTSPAHMDRGDGRGERDVVYIGRYSSCSTYKSTTGTYPLTVSIGTFRSGIQSLGDNIWQMDYAMLVTIWMLYLVEFANWNSQLSIGFGCGTDVIAQEVGSSDSMPYHTGTMQTSRETKGCGVQYRHIEGLWENVFNWCEGIYFSGDKVYGILNPNNFSNTEGGTYVCVRATSYGFISAFNKGNDDYDWFMYPSSVSGTELTYIGDYYVYQKDGNCYFGAYGYARTNYGLFAIGTVSSGVGLGNGGGRLMKLP